MCQKFIWPGNENKCFFLLSVSVDHIETLSLTHTPTHECMHTHTCTHTHIHTNQQSDHTQNYKHLVFYTQSTRMATPRWNKMTTSYINVHTHWHSKVSFPFPHQAWLNSLLYKYGWVELEVDDVPGLGRQRPEEGLPGVGLEQSVLLVGLQRGSQLGCRVHVGTSQPVFAKVTVLQHGHGEPEVSYTTTKGFMWARASLCLPKSQSCNMVQGNLKSVHHCTWPQRCSFMWARASPCLPKSRSCNMVQGNLKSVHHCTWPQRCSFMWVRASPCLPKSWFCNMDQGNLKSVHHCTWPQRCSFMWVRASPCLPKSWFCNMDQGNLKYAATQPQRQLLKPLQAAAGWQWWNQGLESAGQGQLFTKSHVYKTATAPAPHSFFQIATATPHFYWTATGATLFFGQIWMKQCHIFTKCQLQQHHIFTKFQLHHHIFTIFQLHHHMFTKFQPHVYHISTAPSYFTKFQPHAYHIPTEPSYVYQIPTALPQIYHNSNCTITCLSNSNRITKCLLNSNRTTKFQVHHQTFSKLQLHNHIFDHESGALTTEPSPLPTSSLSAPSSRMRDRSCALAHRHMHRGSTASPTGLQGQQLEGCVSVLWCLTQPRHRKMMLSAPVDALFWSV